MAHACIQILQLLLRTSYRDLELGWCVLNFLDCNIIYLVGLIYKQPSTKWYLHKYKIREI